MINEIKWVLKLFVAVLNSIRYRWLIKFNSVVREQRKDPRKIPVFIVNFNQLSSLKRMIEDLINLGVYETNIFVIDNKSTYKPLLDYYNSSECCVRVLRQDENYGHMMFFKYRERFRSYIKRGYYVLTDPDLQLNSKMPLNFLETMIHMLDKYEFGLVKVGLALKIDDLPDFYPLKMKVLNWEGQFWENQLEQNIYKAHVDTTFALYRPDYNFSSSISNGFLNGIRIAGKFECKHLPWYLDPEDLTEESLYYFSTSGKTNTWKI